MCRYILQAAIKIAEFVHKKGVSVLVHCSDGWDRTPQLTSLSVILMDPYYRTIKGLEVLIEKEWISFGHQFAARTGHDGGTKYQERSPVFIQFLDCVFQIMQQFPRAFEYNDALLITIIDECYSCRFGTFLFDSEREKKESGVREKTNSLWSYVNSDLMKYKNLLYQPLNSVIYPSVSFKRLKIWENYHFRNLPDFVLGLNFEDCTRALLLQYQKTIKQLEELLVIKGRV